MYASSDIQDFSAPAAPLPQELPRHGEPAADAAAADPTDPAVQRAGTVVDRDMDAPVDAADEDPPPASTLKVQMLGLAGEGIAALGVRVTLDGAVRYLRTDEEGQLPALHARAGNKLEIAVQRFDGSYKVIDETEMPHGNSQWGYASPKTVFEVETVEHVGEPGEAEQHVPQATDADRGLAPEDAGDAPVSPGVLPAHGEMDAYEEPVGPHAAAASSGLPDGARGKSVDVAARRPDDGPAPVAADRIRNPKPAAAAASGVSLPAIARKPVIPPAISGKPAVPAPQLPQSVGRDGDGNPLTVIAQKVTDWWNRWRLPPWAAWLRPREAVLAAKKPPNLLPQSRSGEKPRFDPKMIEKVAELLNFAEGQTVHLYAAGTATVLTAMANGTFGYDHRRKEKAKAEGQCYQYVKIALARCDIVTGLLGDKMSTEIQASASKAGPALVAGGFVDVTNDVPDARWAAAGDVIVYEWSEITWRARQRGKKDPNYPNHGHIDIRSAESYISDHVPGYFHPRWLIGDKAAASGFSPNYVNVRIYRKIFDPLPVCRLKAFLRCLRDFECQECANDEERYALLHAPLPMAMDRGRRFADFRTHPWEGVPIGKTDPSASGAYQIQYRTWNEIVSRGHLPDLLAGPRFSPIVQDRIAVVIIELSDALQDVRAGRIDESVKKLSRRWTSLPGASENSHRRANGRAMDMAYLLETYERHLAGEKNKAGMR